MKLADTSSLITRVEKDRTFEVLKLYMILFQIVSCYNLDTMRAKWNAKDMSLNVIKVSVI